MRCPPPRLADLAPVLAVIRTWAGVAEPTRHVFSVHGEPFLHFHLGADGRRRADVKAPAGWVSLPLPGSLSAPARALILRELRRRYAARLASKSSGRSGRKIRSNASHKSLE
jgi:hypothetical protein